MARLGNLAPAGAPDLGRVVVIGTSCAGKSTFARRLAAALGQPTIELDELFWDRDWTPKSPADFRALTARSVAQPRWILEGNYSAVRDVVWPRATTVVWLNYSFVLVCWRALRRTLHRSLTREVLWHGNRESFRQSFFSRRSILVWVVTTFHRRRHEFEALRASDTFGQLTWLEFRRPAQADAFLRKIE